MSQVVEFNDTVCPDCSGYLLQGVNDRGNKVCGHCLHHFHCIDLDSGRQLMDLPRIEEDPDERPFIWDCEEK